MTKSELIERIAERAPHVPRQKLERMVNTVFDSMLGALRSEQRIEIRGFGSFGVRVRAAREARNPRTGERVNVPRRLTPFFTPGKELRDRLNRDVREPEPELKSELEPVAQRAAPTAVQRLAESLQAQPAVASGPGPHPETEQESAPLDAAAG